MGWKDPPTVTRSILDILNWLVEVLGELKVKGEDALELAAQCLQPC